MAHAQDLVQLKIPEAQSKMAPDANQRALSNVVRFQILDNQSHSYFSRPKAVGQCSGLLLPPHFLLTARHCFESSLAHVKGYDQVIPRTEFLQRIWQAGVIPEIVLFKNPEDLGNTLQVHVKAIGAGGTYAVQYKDNQLQQVPRGFDESPPGESESSQVQDVLTMQVGTPGDWILLQIPFEVNGNCVPMAIPAPGDSVWAVGAPGVNSRYPDIQGNEVRAVEGKVLSREEASQRLNADLQNPSSVAEAEYVGAGFSDADALNGYSGGAYVDQEGRYLGVEHSAATEVKTSVYLPVQSIVEQLKKDQKSISQIPGLDQSFCGI
jgi:hypothetical protein